MSQARVLVIAGLDPSGKAGLLADVAAIRKAGALPLGCVSALTAQPAQGAISIHPTPPEHLGAQLDAVLGDGPVRAIKLGMVAHPELVRVILEKLSRLPPVPLVIDPVLATSTGAPLLLAGSRRAVYRELARLRPIFTPNLPELAVLSGREVARDEAEEVRQAEHLLAWGAAAVLVKGGHREGDVHDLLVCADGSEQRFDGARMESHARGKGCRLASALAALLAQDVPLVKAVERARGLVREHLLIHRNHTDPELFSVQ